MRSLQRGHDSDAETTDLLAQGAHQDESGGYGSTAHNNGLDVDVSQQTSGRNRRENVVVTFAPEADDSFRRRLSVTQFFEVLQTKFFRRVSQRSRHTTSLIRGSSLGHNHNPQESQYSLPVPPLCSEENTHPADVPSTYNQELLVLFWMAVMAMSFACERLTFKALVDRAGPFRLVAAESVAGLHTLILGAAIAVTSIKSRSFSFDVLNLSMSNIGCEYENNVHLFVVVVPVACVTLDSSMYF
jgi:hypothetical protein